jgi:hypothetical protein
VSYKKHELLALHEQLGSPWVLTISQHGTSVLFTSHPKDGLLVNLYILHNRRAPFKPKKLSVPFIYSGVEQLGSPWVFRWGPCSSPFYLLTCVVFSCFVYLSPPMVPPPPRGYDGDRIGTRFLRPRGPSPLKGVNPAGTPEYINGTD